MLAPSSKLKQELEQHFKAFECAVGINGRIWVKSSNSRLTVAITNAIMNCSHLNDSQLTEYLQTVTDSEFVWYNSHYGNSMFVDTEGMYDYVSGAL